MDFDSVKHTERQNDHPGETQVQNNVKSIKFDFNKTKIKIHFQEKASLKTGKYQGGLKIAIYWEVFQEHKKTLIQYDFFYYPNAYLNTMETKNQTIKI